MKLYFQQIWCWMLESRKKLNTWVWYNFIENKLKKIMNLNSRTIKYILKDEIEKKNK